MKTLSTLLLIALSTSVWATDYQCSNGRSERTVSIIYSTPGQVVPCEVVYSKEGNSETLWRAQNEAGYCEAKAEALAEKLRGWGWQCERQEQGAVEGADGH